MMGQAGGMLAGAIAAPDSLLANFTKSNPTRVIGTSYTPSTTRPSLVTVSGRITCASTITITGGGTTAGQLDLVVNGTAAPGDDLIVNSSTFSGIVLVGVAITNTQVITGTLVAWLKANDTYRVVSTSTTGSPTFAIDRTTEYVF